MKFLLTPFLLLCCLFAGTKAIAQAPEQDCINGIRVCNYLYTQTNSYVGTGTYPAELTAANWGCLLSGERNDVWYIVNVTTAGTLGMNITPVNPADDYDFAVWDITGGGCSMIYNYVTNTANTYPPIGCNYSGTPGMTGLSNTIVGAQWSPALNVTPGMTLAVNVSNFTGSGSGYTLDFGPSTASIFDTVRPRFLEVKSECQTSGSSLTVTMTEPIRCNSVTPDGSQFYITTTPITVVAAAPLNCASPTSYTNRLTIQLSSILPAGTYWLHSRPGTAGPIQDGCGNLQPATPGDSIQFTLFPSDPPKFVRADTPACKRLILHLDRSIKCSTVALDGSDFNITGPSPVDIGGARPLNCSSLGMADSIEIRFNESILLPGAYSVNVRIGTDTNAITDSCRVAINTTFVFYVSDAGFVSAKATPGLLCEPGYVNLTAFLTEPEEAVLPGYLWQTGEYVADSTSANTTAYASSSRTFIVRIKDTAGCYRRAKTDVIVSVRNPMVFSPDTSICPGNYATLRIGGGVRYEWIPSTGLECATCPITRATPLVTTTYRGVIYDQYGCSDTISQTITVYDPPVLTASKDTTIVYGKSVQLYALAPGGKFFMWDPIHGMNNANIPNPIVRPEITTRYIVYVTDTNQCRAQDTVVVKVRRDVPVAVPSGFTPNADGKNDLFRVANVTFQRVFEFRVFNRWGQEVFFANDNRGWDGTWKGVAQDIGDYKYIARVAYPDGSVQTYQGDVTLIR